MNFKKTLEKIKQMFNCTYVLSHNEISTWKNIERKAKQGWQEWFDKTKGDDLCGPWISNIEPNEVNLIDKIHKIFYGDDWYVVMPLHTSQVCYVQYMQIKDKVQ
jgi:hypothetical protein